MVDFRSSNKRELFSSLVYGVFIHQYLERSPYFNSNSYRNVASSDTSCLEAHAGFFKLLMNGTFDPYILLPFEKKLIS